MKTLKTKILTLLLLAALSTFASSKVKTREISKIEKSEVVEIVSLFGSSNNNTNLVTWVSEFDLKRERYIVERSSDGVKFSEINSLVQKNRFVQSYSISDPNPETITYYRIKILNFEGDIYTSEVIAIRNTFKVNG